MKTFDEIYDTLPGNGWLSRAEAELLYRAASECDGPILEVGCYEGRSTVLLASLGRPVYAVDPFGGFHSEDPSGERTFTTFISNMASRKITNVILTRKRIEDCYPILLSKFGFAYLDGDHTYRGTREQIEAAVWRQSDIIAIHDVNDSGDGAEVKRAALELLGPWDERVERLAVWRMRR